MKNEFPVHGAVKSYVNGGSIVKNVENHLEKNFILKLDFRCFFNSIKKGGFRNFLTLKSESIALSFEKEYIDLICDISFKGSSSLEGDLQGLPIGAGTSPLVSNIILYELDEKISDYCQSKDITYTRYADDLTFSHNKKGKMDEIKEKVESFLKEIPYLSSIKINNKKMVHMSKRGRRKITGLYLTPQGKISIGRERKNRINKLFRDYEETQAHKIRGHLNFIRNVEKDFFDRLYKKWVTGRGDNKFKHLFTVKTR